MNAFLITSQPSVKKQRLLFALLMAGFIIFALFIFSLTTRWGTGITSDSLIYIQNARNILTTHSLTGLSNHYPPLYSIFLALTGLISGDTLLGARYLQAIVFALQIVVFGAALWTATRRSMLYTALGMLILLSSSTVLLCNVMTLSEGLFTLFTLIALIFLGKGIETGRNKDHEKLTAKPQLKLILLAAFFTSCAVLTRYIGVILILNGILAVMLTRQGIRNKILGISVFIVVSGSLLGIWLLRNLLNTESITGRQLTYHPVRWSSINEGIGQIMYWFHLPNTLPMLLVVAGLAACLIWHHGRQPHSSKSGVVAAFGLFIPLYLMFLLFSISFIDANTPLDQRILYPLHMPILFCIVVGIHRFAEEFTNKIHFQYLLPVIVSGAMLSFSIPQFNAQAALVTRYAEIGIGYASRRWVESPTLQLLKTIPPETPIYTNGPEPINFYLDRKTAMIPRIKDPGTRTNNPHYLDQINEMSSKLKAGNGYIVYFSRINWRWYLPTIEQLLSIPSMKGAKIVFAAGEDRILSIKPNSTENNVE